MWEPVLVEKLVPKRRFFLPSSLISTLAHIIAIVLLVANPEIVFNPKAFARQNREQASESQLKGSQLITYLYHPKTMFAPPTRRPQGDFYSDQDRTARSNPPQPAKGGNKLPYSRGNTKIPTATEAHLTEPEQKDKAQQQAEALQTASKDVGSEAKDKGAGVAAGEVRPMPEANAFFTPKEIPAKPIVAAGSPEAASEQGGGNRDSERTQQVAQAASKPQPPARIFDNEESAIKSEGTGFFDTKGFYLGDYVNEVVRRVTANWIIPRELELKLQNVRGRLTVVFYIERDGQVSGLRLVASSGSLMLDRTAINSIIGSSPFPPLPKGFPGEHLGAKFVFSWNEN